MNKSERPVDALAVKNINHSLTHSVTDNLKSRDASASKKEGKGYNFTKLLVSVIMAKYSRIGTGRKK